MKCHPTLLQSSSCILGVAQSQQHSSSAIKAAAPAITNMSDSLLHHLPIWSVIRCLTVKYLLFANSDWVMTT